MVASAQTGPGHGRPERAPSVQTENDDELDEKIAFPPLELLHFPAPTNDSYNESASAVDLRAEASRINDDLELLRAERLVSNREHDEFASRTKNRSHSPEPEDAFNPSETKEVVHKDKNEQAVLYKIWLFLKKFPRPVRYVVYLLPGALLLLPFILIGVLRYADDDKLVGGPAGTRLEWFGAWLEIVWCSLWLCRLITCCMPPIFYRLARIAGSTNAKKWRDIGQQLELHTAFFLWLLANLASFLPTVDQHRGSGDDGANNAQSPQWIEIVKKVLIALFTLATLNLVEKVLIQWIASSFHQRTYSTRIEKNKADTTQLVQLFEFAKARLEHSDSFWQGNSATTVNGAQTPMRTLHDNARQMLGKVGYVANKVGNDFIGRKVHVNQPRKVVSELLRSTSSSHTLARLIYRSLVREDRETVHHDDLKNVFQTDEEIDAAFGVFDKDLNGDISMEEFEAVCNEIHLEKKAIAASLKDLDSVIQKLDKVFLFIIVVIAIIVFISILSSSAAAGLASAGGSFLGLAWMLQATAQEFLQSIIFVFIKHPFDVGDRVTIYGSTGTEMKGDDYYVTEISLLYTEFKKMQGHIVQAPNSILNTLFILNQRRSNGLADVISLDMRFGTPASVIEELKTRMLDFCLENKRDYHPTIITELTQLKEVQSCSMNVIFKHKSNFQNELLRLTRHNRFVTELMHQMTQLDIQGPVRLQPGGSRETPLYWTGAQLPPPYGREQQTDEHGPPPAPSNRVRKYSTRSRRLPTTEEEAINGRQDVYDMRREQAVLPHRLASIRERERNLAQDGEDEPRASTSALSQTASRESRSGRGRIFSRVRTWTKNQQDEPV